MEIQSRAKARGFKPIFLMSPAKLTDTDKQLLVDLYRETPATTTTLAERFGVSSSTISRLLKNAIASGEYESLVQEKRSARGGKADDQLTLPLASQGDKPANTVKSSDDAPVSSDQTQTTSGPGRRTRTRSRVVTKPQGVVSSPGEEIVGPKPSIAPPKLNPLKKAVAAVILPQASKTNKYDEYVDPEDDFDEDDVEPVVVDAPSVPKVAIDETAINEIVKDLDEDLLDDEDLEDLEDDEDEDDEDDFEEEDDEDDAPVLLHHDNANGDITILPFAEAVIPQHAYLVVDRSGELIVRPLKEFTLDGTVPNQEVGQKTLPIFDNHRVARRFSMRTHRVIKVTHSQLFHKAAEPLKRKGITRVFLDGQVYSL